MTVNRKRIVAENELPAVPEAAVVEVAEVADAPAVPVETIQVDPKVCASEHIMEAIKCLSKIAKVDEVAKDSIANLAVVMFDLK